MKKYILLITAFLALTGSAMAQSPYASTTFRQVYSVNWNITVPSGGYSDYISNTSLSGMNFSAMFFLSDHFALGGDVTWNYYKQDVPRTTYYLTDNSAVTASQFRYAQSFPLKFIGQYYFNPAAPVKVFAGLGLGAIATTSHIIVQDFDFWNQEWGFLASPEVGVLIPFGRTANYGARLSAGYNYSTNGTQFSKIDINNQQGFFFNIGLFFGVF